MRFPDASRIRVRGSCDSKTTTAITFSRRRSFWRRVMSRRQLGRLKSRTAHRPWGPTAATPTTLTAMTSAAAATTIAATTIAAAAATTIAATTIAAAPTAVAFWPSHAEAAAVGIFAKANRY